MSIQTLRAEPQLMRLLALLNGQDQEISQLRADTMLARIAWSRIAEPGDGAAGTLINAVGVEHALDLLVQGTTAEALQAAISARSSGLDAEFSGRTAAEAISRWTQRLHRGETVRDIERACDAKLRVLLPGDDQWPKLLDDLGVHAPNMLWVRGEPGHLSAYSLGVVGARAATGYGSHVTAELVDGVCAAGVSIVSGAAYGIDAVAHRTALATGTLTIAVVAGGADRPYPRAHETLLDRISSAGAVCSEMVPDAAPTKWRFLQRNRLIAALSQATLVTEAGVRSGSLNTAGQPVRVLLYVRCLLISWVGCTVPTQQRLARPRRSGSAAAGHQRSRPNASGRTSAASCRSTSGGTGKRALQQTQQQAQPRAQQRPRSGSAVVAARQHSKHRRDTPERSFLL